MHTQTHTHTILEYTDTVTMIVFLSIRISIGYLFIYFCFFKLPCIFHFLNNQKHVLLLNRGKGYFKQWDNVCQRSASSAKHTLSRDFIGISWIWMNSYKRNLGRRLYVQGSPISWWSSKEIERQDSSNIPSLGSLDIGLQVDVRKNFDP